MYAVTWVCLLGLISAAVAQTTEVMGTHFTNREVIEIGAKAQQVFIASTCSHFDTFSVNVGLQLFHNPEWKISKGVVRFYVTDVAPAYGQPLAPEAILCTNSKDSETPPSPNCTVTSWNGAAKELFVVATNGDVGGIAYSILVEFGKPTPPLVEGYTKRSNETYVHPDIRHTPWEEKPIYLTQTVRSTIDVEVPMGGDVLLTVVFCPDSSTTDHYQITSTLIGTTVHGAFNQYICKSTTPQAQCHPDNAGVIGSNPNQVPINVASVVTTVGDLEELWVRVYCWDGDDVGNGTYIGRFKYGAALSTIAP